MRFRVLGSLELVGVRADGAADVDALPSARLRRLLAVLVVHANAVVSADRLVEVVWGDALPVSPSGALQTLVSRLRRALGAGGGVELLTRSPGYLLRVTRDQVDALRFTDLVAEARGQPPACSAALLDEALALWRGRAYAEFADDEFARPEAARLEELRLAAREDRFGAALALGHHNEVIGPLEAFAVAHPLRERAWGQLMLALHRGGRSAEALRVYRELRDRLGGELGLEPSPALRQLERDILRQDPALVPARQPEPALAGNLPGQLTDLVGREQELAGVAAALERARVVTLVGVGGVGKTRLALRAAAGAGARYPDGMWLCELAAVGDPAAVAGAVATVLGVQQRQGATVVERLVEFLRPKRLLLILDNCEHVLEAASRLVDAVARGCPHVTVMATSREPLGIDGEHVRPVPPLAVPPRFAHPAHAGTIASVALFRERAEEASPDFALTGDNVAAIAEICRRLDGIPLALELAATRVRSMSAADIAGRLQARFRLLRSGSRIAEERHRTLRGLVDWSYGLLTSHEQRVFERLSVFAADFDLRAAERVCAAQSVEEADVAGLVTSLVDKSMVVAQARGAVTRYALLETLREYGRERLDEHADPEAVRRAHAEHYVAFAEAADPGLRGPDEARWVEALGRELDELRAAHAWTVAHDLDLALRLSAALFWYAEMRMTSEIFAWAERAAAAADAAGLSDPLLPVVLASAAGGARFQGDLERAWALAERALAMTGAHDDAAKYPLIVLADVALFDGRLEDAARISAAAARLARDRGDLWYASYVTGAGTLARAYGGDDAAALALAGEAQQLAETTANPSALGWARYLAGEVLLDQDPDRAIRLLEGSVALMRPVDNRYLGGVALVSAGSLHGRHGDPHKALPLFRDVIEHWHQVGNRPQQWTTLRNLVGLLVRLGSFEAAAVLYGAQEDATTASAVFGADADRLAATGRTLQARLGDEAFAAAITRGMALTDDEAVTLASTAIDQFTGPERA